VVAIAFEAPMAALPLGAAAFWLFAHSVFEGLGALRVARDCGISAGKCTLNATLNLNFLSPRVMAQSAPDEVLVSRVVTDLVAGAGLRFSERGSHELKGLPGKWDLFAASA
jgi:class 3 adenylate cyclase